jgi:hypothetical protein
MMVRTISLRRGVISAARYAGGREGDRVPSEPSEYELILLESCFSGSGLEDITACWVAAAFALIASKA